MASRDRTFFACNSRARTRHSFRLLELIGRFSLGERIPERSNVRLNERASPRLKFASKSYSSSKSLNDKLVVRAQSCTATFQHVCPRVCVLSIRFQARHVYEPFSLDFRRTAGPHRDRAWRLAHARARARVYETSISCCWDTLSICRRTVRAFHCRR